MPRNGSDKGELDAELRHVPTEDAEWRIRRAFRLILEAAAEPGAECSEKSETDSPDDSRTRDQSETDGSD